MFKIPYKGLTNRGIHTQIYIEISLPGSTLTNPAWNVIQKPEGSNLASGIYLCRMNAGNYVKVNKMLLLI